MLAVVGIISDSENIGKISLHVTILNLERKPSEKVNKGVDFTIENIKEPYIVRIAVVCLSLDDYK